MKRRTFLKGTLGMGALLVAPMSGCSDPTPPANMPDEHGVAHGALQKGPYVQLLDAGTARIVFETMIDEETPVRVIRGGHEETLTPTRVAVDLDYFRPTLGPKDERDMAGVHVLHELQLEDLQPGERVRYVVEQHAGDPIEAEFLAPIAANEGFKLGWISDTMYPLMEEPINALTRHAPDLVIHGGDITYDSSPFDSWNTFMAMFQPLLRSAATHFIVGNHEFESQNEIEVQFDRLFARQGESGSKGRYHAIRYGGVVFLILDSESREEADIRTEGSEQLQWLDAQLEAANDDPSVREIVVAFHRPTYTLSKHSPGNTDWREQLHDRFLVHGVRLVLNGHVHAFEHFEVEGVNYVVDGGGGALLYDPDEDIDEIEALRPGEPDLRVTRERSTGVSTIDFHADGGFHYQRFDAKTGELQHSFTVD